METDKVVSIQVGPEVIKPIVEAKVHAAIVDALGGNETLIQNMVTVIMNSRVDSHGNFSNSTYNTKSLIQWLCESLVQSAAEHAIKEHISKQRDRLVAEFERQFAKKSKSIAEEMVSGVINSAQSKWAFKLDLNYKEKA